MKTLLLSATLLATAAAGAAVAQTAPPARPMMGDTNGDGRVTRAEYVAQAEQRFATLDTNRDGALTQDEMRAGRPMRGPGAGAPPAAAAATPAAPATAGRRGGGGGGMAMLDTDGDGRITRAEYDAGSRTRFERMDTNRDGKIDATERAAMPGGGRMMGAGTDPMTLANFTQAAGRRFDRMDGNGDGVIDATEMAAGRAMRGGDGTGRRGRRAMPQAPATPDAS